MNITQPTTEEKTMTLEIAGTVYKVIAEVDLSKSPKTQADFAKRGITGMMMVTKINGTKEFMAYKTGTGYSL